VRLGRYTRSYAHDQTFALLQLPDPPTALVAAGTSVATGVLAALHTADVDVPGRLSLVACDDTDTLQLHRPAVNTVRRDACQLGSSAAELLLRMLLDRAQPSRIVLPTEYVVRESVSRPPR
jgi:LacI family transcriptional regulator